MDYPISELRIIHVHFRDHGVKPANSRAVHYMHFSQVEKFVNATVMLHYYNGNPHVRGFGGIGCCQRLDNLWRITETQLQIQERSFWWSEENLGMNENSSRSGAVPLGMGKAYLNARSASVDLWLHPDLVEEIKKQDEFERLND